MLLSHFTDANHLDPYPVAQSDEPGRKPKGLWVSVDGPNDWYGWCVDNEFRQVDQQHRFRIELAADARILLLDTDESLPGFTSQYRHHLSVGRSSYINWASVASQYQGIVIAPFHRWQHLYGVDWYYGWDCASGCIWDTPAIANVHEITQEVAA